MLPRGSACPFWGCFVVGGGSIWVDSHRNFNWEQKWCLDGNENGRVGEVNDPDRWEMGGSAKKEE